ncbi:MAG: VOC family protein [Nitrospiria bacterium]
MGNPFVHIELLSNDLEKAKGFYKDLFDWQYQEFPEMDYTIIEVGEGTGGGMMKNPVPDIPSHWLSYVQVDDIEASTQKAKSLGGQVVKEVTEVPGYGWLSVIVDPSGAALGLWKPAEECAEEK